MKYKFINDRAVVKIDDDGVSRSSCSFQHQEYLDWLALGNITEAADPNYNIQREDILAKLEKNDLKSIRALREKDEIRIAELEAKAVQLRQELAAIPS